MSLNYKPSSEPLHNRSPSTPQVRKTAILEKATMGGELMAPITDRTTGVTSPVTTNHAAKGCVFVNLRNAGSRASEFRVQGSGFRVQGAGCRVQDPGFRVQGQGFRVQGAGFRVQGSGFRVQGVGFTWKR